MKINRQTILVLILLSVIFSNSRVAFSRPGSVLRTPGTMILQNQEEPLLFSVGFSTEVVNIDLKSASSSIYLQGRTNSDYYFGVSYTYLADPRTKNQIAPEIIEEEAEDYNPPTEIGLHIQKRIYSVGNINIDVGINDVLARQADNTSSLQNPSFFALFSSKKDFEKYSMTFNYGFGTGKVGYDKQVPDNELIIDEEFIVKPYIGFNLLTPELRRLKNSIRLLFEYDGTGINLGMKIPITNEYLLSLGVVHFSNMGDFGMRSKIGNYDEEILSDAATLCLGFQMNVPKKPSKIASKIVNNPYSDNSSTHSGADGGALYTQEAVNQLIDSLNTQIQDSDDKYSAIEDSIRFLTFSEENLGIENALLNHKISSLEDSLSDYHNQKALDIKNFNKASRHVSKSLRYFYEQDFTKALIEIDKAIEINPNLSIAYARKGTIYYSLGEIQKASINWNIALKLDPEYDEVRDILEALKNNRLKPADLERKQ